MEIEKKLVLHANLQDEVCKLKHDEDRQAVYYIYQAFTFGDVVIPICEECGDKLYSEDWVLLYCMECHNNFWIYKPESKKPWLYEKDEHIKWLPQCPYCWRGGDKEY